jgi:Cd2+/Zn2+-exporting ATPase
MPWSQAQGSRAPTQRFVDRFAAVYTPAVFALACWPWPCRALAVRLARADWVYKALVLLVIACPCALVISTPVTIVSGLAAAARRGILIKGGVYLEGARKLKALALDKTGTLTEGKPRLVDVVLMVDNQPAEVRGRAHRCGAGGHSGPPGVARHRSRPHAEQCRGPQLLCAVRPRHRRPTSAARRYVLGNHRPDRGARPVLCRDRGRASSP